MTPSYAFFSCFYSQMERMILKSMDHIVKVFGHITTIPKLNFKLKFVVSKCVSVPSVNDICDQYCSVLNLVSVIIKTYCIAFIIMIYKYEHVTFFNGISEPR